MNEIKNNGMKEQQYIKERNTDINNMEQIKQERGR